MCKLWFFFIFIFLTVNTLAQRDSSGNHTPVQADYLRKSKHQKITGWILLGAGSSLIAAGFITANNVPHPENPTATTGPAFLAICGFVSDLASIPFFISSRKNKRRAAAIGVNYEPSANPQLRNYPSSGIASLKVNLFFSGSTLISKKIP